MKRAYVSPRAVHESIAEGLVEGKAVTDGGAQGGAQWPPMRAKKASAAAFCPNFRGVTGKKRLAIRGALLAFSGVQRTQNGWLKRT